MFANDCDENSSVSVALRWLLRQMESEKVALSSEMAKAYENACNSLGRWPILTTKRPALKDYGKSITVEDVRRNN